MVDPIIQRVSSIQAGAQFRNHPPYVIHRSAATTNRTTAPLCPVRTALSFTHPGAVRQQRGGMVDNLMCLASDWATPLKNMISSVGMMKFPILLEK